MVQSEVPSTGPLRSPKPRWQRRLRDLTLALVLAGPLPSAAQPFPTPPSAITPLVEPAPALLDAPHTVVLTNPPVQPSLPYRDLHPVRDPFVARWQQATARQMAGPGASPWYRDVASDLDVRWRLAEQSPAPLLIEQGVRDQALDMVLVGSITGWNEVVRQTMRRSPELTPIHTAVQSALTPGLRVDKSASGRTRVGADGQEARNQQAAMADISQGPTVQRTNPRAVQTSVRTGSAVTLFRLPDSSDIQPGANDSPLRPGLTSWIDVRNVVFDAARVQTRVQQDPERNRFRPNVRWVAVARQGLMPDWSVVADIQGSPEALRPTRNGVALEHRLTRYGLPEWAIRASAGQQLRDDLGPDIREERVMLVLRTNLGWYLPQDIDRWPLGHRPGAPGMPTITPDGPSAPRPLVASPAERTGARPLDIDGLADQ